jgi:hypothetical protein
MYLKLLRLHCGGLGSLHSCKRYGLGKAIVSPDACAFPKLYHIHLTARPSVRIMALPNLRTMRIEGCEELRIFSHKISTCASHRFESLEIVDTLGSVYENPRAL